MKNNINYTELLNQINFVTVRFGSRISGAFYVPADNINIRLKSPITSWDKFLIK